MPRDAYAAATPNAACERGRRPKHRERRTCRSPKRCDLSRQQGEGPLRRRHAARHPRVACALAARRPATTSHPATRSRHGHVEPPSHDKTPDHDPRRAARPRPSRCATPSTVVALLWSLRMRRTRTGGGLERGPFAPDPLQRAWPLSVALRERGCHP